MSNNIVPKRKVVTAQSSTSSPSTSSAQPRARAKVDLSSIATPPAQRPSIRSTPSSASLRSGVSSSAGPSRQPLASPSLNVTSPHTWASSPAHTPTQVRSPPVPPYPQRPPSRSEHAKSTPVLRARATPLQRSVTAQTPTKNLNVNTVASNPAHAGPSTGQTVVDRGRAKVKSSISVPTSNQPSRSVSRSRISESPQPSPALLNDNRSDIGHGYLHDYEVPMERVTSHHSSPGRPPHAILHPHMYSAIDHIIQHPTASCPSSPPLPAADYRHATRLLPINPNATVVGLFPAVPLSPEVKTISLPIMTPRRLSESSSIQDDRRLSGTGSYRSELSESAKPSTRNTPDGPRWSGSTLVDSENLGFSDKPPDGGEVQVMKEALREEAEEAKVNRKIADLEISNASLMAINRLLEAEKAKQRAEILKLRRALRESMDGTGTFRPMMSPLGLMSPSTEDPEYGDPSDTEDDVDDAEVDQRWDKVQELIGAMQRRGEAAVMRGKEDIKIAAQRVLDWTEVEGDQSVDETGLGTGAGTPEVETPEG